MKCPLCGGKLSMDFKVEIGHLENGKPFYYSCAWVCVSCKSAFPVAARSAIHPHGFEQ